MYRQKKILFIGNDTKLLARHSADAQTEVVSSISFVDAITQRFIPDLIIFDSFRENDVQILRRNEKFLLIPVLIVADSFSQLNNLNSISSFPRVILCNRSVAEDNAFFERMKLLLEKKSSLLPSRTALLVKYAILFLNKNYARPLTRESLASQLGIAEDYLSRIFKKEMGLTLWNYLTLLRLDFARREILLTGDSVAAIALRSGFTDPAYFDRLFKKQYGTSPTTLRH